MKLRTALLLSLFLAVTFQVNAQHRTELPDTAAGKCASVFLRMLGSKDDAALKDFILNIMVPNNEITFEQRMERFRGIRANLGQAKLLDVLKATENNIVFVIETGKGETKKITLDVAEDNNKRIGGFGVEPFDKNAAGAAAEAAKPLSETEFIPALQNYLDKLTKADKFSGVVLVAKNGAPVFLNAYGMADRDKKIANQVNTKFNIGSENKIFTQLAIGMLADEGKLALGDKLGKYLPDYPNKEAAENVTIEQLVAMKSGIGDFFGPKFEAADKSRIRSLQDYFPFFAAEPLLFPPGTKSRYSNGGYIVLGAIIEKVSGKSYYDFVRERIFKPAGMSDTDSYEFDAKAANMAEGYTMNITPGRLLNNFPTRPARGSSAGGGFSTAEDMLRFANALESGKLPAPGSMKDSAEPIVRMLAGGLGIAGGSPGVNAAFSTKVKGMYTVVVMSNLDPPSAEEVSRQIRTWLGPN
jgi:CubicO group peptidase (beta-lactamase class C family)